MTATEYPPTPVWQESYDKWSGDLWGRLLAEEEEVKEISTPPHYNSRERFIFKRLLWAKCSYCHKYIMCSSCPLHVKACNGSLYDDGTIIYQMFLAWSDKDKEKFEKLQEELLLIMERTRFQ